MSPRVQVAVPPASAPVDALSFHRLAWVPAFDRLVTQTTLLV